MRLAEALASADLPEHQGAFGLGRVALPTEIAAWDRDILPDGTGLPVGRGNVEDGEMLFVDYCAVCHGDFAEGVGNWPKLAGGEDTLADEDPLKTVGSYWPYLSTTFDYVRRSMPFGNAQSLSDDEVYAIVAYILYSNYLVEEDFELSNETFLGVDMPNADGFIVDDRAEAEYAIWTTDSDAYCTVDCKDSVEITMRAAVLDVTPVETEAEELQQLVEATDPDAGGAAEVAAMAGGGSSIVMTGAFDAELVASGEKVFKKCKACHQIGAGAENKSGPQLNQIAGRLIGGADGFKYSGALSGMADQGLIWTDEALAGFLRNPKAYAKGTKMSFAGLKKETDILAVIEYLKSAGQ
ncbi:MAG: c-type cytochrome [Paracoccaceae bacterium]|nr:c-type cytochrome [Paracoccaceae bacterium]